MVKHRSTSGLMLLDCRKVPLIHFTIIVTVHVLTTDLMVLFHHSLEMTIIVIVELIVIQRSFTYGPKASVFPT